MFGSYRLFRLFGFEVKLDLSWLLLALLITWTLAAGMFPADYPDLSKKTYWWMGVAGAVGIFFSIVFHELSHSLVARRYDLPIRGITLFIFGGVAQMEHEPPSPKAEFFMAIAGPLASFLLAFLFFQLETLATSGAWPTAIIGIAHYLGIVNMVVAVFNLVPAFPLDGGRMLRALLWQWKKNLLDATRLSSQIGAGFGLVLMILGVLAFIQGNFIGGMWWFLIGAFLRGAARTSYQQMVLHEMIQGEPASRFMRREPVTVPPSINVRQLLEDYVYRYHFRMFPVVEDAKLLGCITLEDVKKIPSEQWPQKQVRDLSTPPSSANTISPDMDTAKLLSAMNRPDAPVCFMVAEDERLVGVISLRDLREIIELKLEIEQSPG